MWKEFIPKFAEVCTEVCGRSLCLNVQKYVEGVHTFMWKVFIPKCAAGVCTRSSYKCAEVCGRSLYVNVQRYAEGIHN